MKFEEALVAMHDGAAIRRPSWEANRLVIKRGVNMETLPKFVKRMTFSEKDVLAVDWEAVPVPRHNQAIADDQVRYLVRFTSMAGDSVVMRETRKDAWVWLFEKCRLSWAVYFGKTFSEWKKDKKYNEKRSRDVEALTRLYLVKSEETDHYPARVSVTEVTLPASKIGVRGLYLPKKPARTRALDLEEGQ